MYSFARLCSIVTLLLSLGSISQALPTTPVGATLAVREHGSPVPCSSKASLSPTSNGNARRENNLNIVRAPDTMIAFSNFKNQIASYEFGLKGAKTVDDAERFLATIATKTKTFAASFPNQQIDAPDSVKGRAAASFLGLIKDLASDCASLSTKLGGAKDLTPAFAELDHSLVQVLGLSVNSGDNLAEWIKAAYSQPDSVTLANLKHSHFDGVLEVLGWSSKAEATAV